MTFEAPIKLGQQDAVRELVSRMVAFNQQGEPDTVLYRVFMREYGEVLAFIEGYAQSDAMLFAHRRHRRPSRLCRLRNTTHRHAELVVRRAL